MKVRDVMTRDVVVARPDDTIQSVASHMASGGFGFVPVCDGERLVGTLTDRDLAVRALAIGASPETRASEVMTHDVAWCRDDEDLKTVLHLMSERQVRRLPIVDKDNKLVGVVSLGDLSIRVKEKYAGEALESISRT